MGPQHTLQSAQYIADTATRVEKLLGDLRLLEGLMRTPPGPTHLEMPIIKAETSLEALEGWISGLHRRHAQDRKKLSQQERLATLLEGERQKSRSKK